MVGYIAGKKQIGFMNVIMNVGSGFGNDPHYGNPLLQNQYTQITTINIHVFPF